MPTDSLLTRVLLGCPCRRIPGKLLDRAYPFRLETLACLAAQLVLRDIQPNTVFRGVPELDTLDQLAGLLRWKSLIEGPGRVGVEVVAHKNHFLCLGISGPQQVCHFQGPIHLGPPVTDTHLTPANQRLREDKNACHSGSLILVINTFRLSPSLRDRPPDFPGQLEGCSSIATTGQAGLYGSS